MRRKLVCVFITIILLLELGIKSGAVGETGSICVNLRFDSGAVTLYKVGSPISGGYMLKQEFGGGVLSKNDIFSSVLAQWLTEQVESEGWTLPADEQGLAEFSRLEEGLYLLVQNQATDGYYPFLPFLVELPYEGQWHIQANPKIEVYPTEQPQTGQSMEPYYWMIAMAVSGVGLMACWIAKRKRKT